MKERVLILALTYGEPAQAKFGDQYHYSLSILKRLTRIVAPIPRPFLPLLAMRRARLRVKTWRAEQFSSPLEEITDAQVALLAAVLRRSDPARDYEIRVVYEFRPPLLPEVLDELEANPPDHLILLPMYLADSDFTTGVSQRDLKTWSKKHGHEFSPAPQMVSEFSEDMEMADLMARFVAEQLAEAGWKDTDCAEAGLILGAHGTVIDPPPGIDGGLATMQCFLRGLTDCLAPRFAETLPGWLNHTLGGEWTSPDLKTAASQLVERGVKRVVYFPYGFLADNAETLLEGRVVLRGHDLEVLHLPCVNSWPPFIDYLAGRILRRLD